MAKKRQRKRPPAARRATKAASSKGTSAKRANETAQPAKLPALSGVAKELFTRVLNSIAFEQYGNCCSVEDLAEKLGKPSGRLQPAIRKLVDQGYVTLAGDIYPVVYPTAAALRHQNPKLSLHEAEQILAKVHRG